jgi:integrase
VKSIASQSRSGAIWHPRLFNLTAVLRAWERLDSLENSSSSDHRGGFAFPGCKSRLEAGIHIKAVADLLGHSSIAITADVYGHTSDDTARAAVDGLATPLGL